MNHQVVFWRGYGLDGTSDILIIEQKIDMLVNPLIQ